MNNTKNNQGYDNYSMNSNQRSHYSVNANNLNIDNIPFAKSYSNINPSQNKNNSILYSTGLNLMQPRTPVPQDDKYRQAYQNCDQAKSLIQTRLNKLMYEKKLLGEMKQNYNPYNADYESIYKLRTMGNAKGKLGNPHLYNNQFMEPIYYPLEMPVCGEPIALPKIEIGHSMGNKKCCGGLGIDELLALLSKFNQPEPPIVYPPPAIIPPPPPPQPRKIKKRESLKI